MTPAEIDHELEAYKWQAVETGDPLICSHCAVLRELRELKQQQDLGEVLKRLCEHHSHHVEIWQRENGKWYATLMASNIHQGTSVADTPEQAIRALAVKVLGMEEGG